MDDAACEQELWQLPDGELVQALLAAEVRLRRDYGRMLALVAEAEGRGLAGRLGYRDSVSLLSESLRVGPGDARARVAQAGATVPGRAVSGAETEPAMAAVGQALAAGEIGAEHVRELHRVHTELARRLDAGECARAEADLVELARQSVPGAVRTAGRRLLAYLDQDGAPPGEDDPAEASHRRNGGGSAAVTAVTDGCTSTARSNRRPPVCWRGCSARWLGRSRRPMVRPTRGV